MSLEISTFLSTPKYLGASTYVYFLKGTLFHPHILSRSLSFFPSSSRSLNTSQTSPQNLNSESSFGRFSRVKISYPGFCPKVNLNCPLPRRDTTSLQPRTRPSIDPFVLSLQYSSSPRLQLLTTVRLSQPPSSFSTSPQYSLLRQKHSATRHRKALSSTDRTLLVSSQLPFFFSLSVSYWQVLHLDSTPNLLDPHPNMSSLES